MNQTTLTFEMFVYQKVSEMTRYKLQEYICNMYNQQRFCIKNAHKMPVNRFLKDTKQQKNGEQHEIEILQKIGPNCE